MCCVLRKNHDVFVLFFASKNLRIVGCVGVVWRWVLQEHPGYVV